MAYDGTMFRGWQVQSEGDTVQGELESAFRKIVGVDVRVIGSGRTDAGVHAIGQVAHFDDPKNLPSPRLRAALNAHLPPAIRVQQIHDVAPDFHALAESVHKTYFYQLHLGGRAGEESGGEAPEQPWRQGFFHVVHGDLDVEAMRGAAAQLVGRRDFSALSKVMDDDRGTVRTVISVRVLRVPRGLRIFVTADGFLYGMVRLMSGLLVDVGRGAVAVDAIPDRLATQTSANRSPALPSQGLFLWRVCYPNSRSGRGGVLP